MTKDEIIAADYAEFEIRVCAQFEKLTGFASVDYDLLKQSHAAGSNVGRAVAAQIETMRQRNIANNKATKYRGGILE